MEGDMLGYYFYIMGCVGVACWLCPKIKKVGYRICCEESDDEEYDEEEYREALDRNEKLQWKRVWY